MNWCKIGWHDWVEVESKEFNHLLAEEISKLVSDAIVGKFSGSRSFRVCICARCGKKLDEITEQRVRAAAHAKLKVDNGDVRRMSSLQAAMEMASNYKVPR